MADLRQKAYRPLIKRASNEGRNAEGVEGRKSGGGVPRPSRQDKGVWRTVVSSLSWVRDGAPAENDSGAF